MLLYVLVLRGKGAYKLTITYRKSTRKEEERIKGAGYEGRQHGTVRDRIEQVGQGGLWDRRHRCFQEREWRMFLAGRERGKGAPGVMG